MKLYHYPNCSTCKKAIKHLTEHDINAELIDIGEQAPSLNELKTMLAAYEGNIRKLFNTSGMQYRELNMKDRLPTMSDNDALQLLSENGMLVKRPFLLTQGAANATGLVGFKQDEWSQLGQ